jgi:hypothetical protein
MAAKSGERLAMELRKAGWSHAAVTSAETAYWPNARNWPNASCGPESRHTSRGDGSGSPSTSVTNTMFCRQGAGREEGGQVGVDMERKAKRGGGLP